MRKIAVRVDPDLQDLIPGFLQNKRRDASEIAAAAERADFAALRGFGHRLKGEGGGYGFEPLSEIGGALERAAQAEDLAAVRDCHRALAEYLEAVEVVSD